MFFEEKGLSMCQFITDSTYGSCIRAKLLKIVIVRELFARHNTFLPREQCHSWFAGNSPFDHFAVWLTGMIDEARYGTSSGIYDHILIERHKVIALLACQRSWEIVIH